MVKQGWYHVFTFVRLSCVLVALGAGLLASLLIPGWFARVLVGIILIVLGVLIAGCRR